MMGFTEFLIILLASSPALVFWIAVIIFAAVMLRRGGGRAERFLITGASLKILRNLLGIPVAFIPPWLVDRGYGVDYSVSITTSIGIFLNIISMAGIICFIYAFWTKFREWNSEVVEITT